jgi:epsilon-lactone hydrolase
LLGLGFGGKGGFDAFSSALGVSIEPTTVGGVKAFILTPKEIPKAHKNQLFNIHGGGYVFSPGEAGTGEAALMAAYGG